jgi:transposase
MELVPKLPKKVQYLMEFSLPIIETLLPRKPFVGGRIGYSKEQLFGWLLVKKVTNWGYRTIGEMAAYSHSTLVRANQRFIRKGVYQKVLTHLVKVAYRQGLITGKKVAIDSSFVKTFSRKEEVGSDCWNGHKEAYGFKLHALIDAETGVPIALIVGDGTTHDSQVAIPLLKKARPWLKRVGYVLADKGYDSSDIVCYIAKSLHAKAGIPIKKTVRNKMGKRSGNFLNWKLKAVGRTFKKSIYNKRGEIERFFSTLKRSFHLGHEETRGIDSFLGNAYLACICFMVRKLFIVGVRSI